MSDDVGIPSALDANGHRFTRRDVEREPQPFVRPLRCGGCSAPVSPVRGHPRQQGTRTAQVVPHYRLSVGGEHERRCPFNFHERATEIVEQSRGTVEKRRGRYRLLIPEDDPLTDPVDDRLSRPHLRSKLLITPSRRLILGETLSSAARIARLLRMFDRDPDTVERFCAVYGGQEIRWRDFYVTPDDLTLAADRLDRGLGHPMAIHGVVHHRGTSARGTDRKTTTLTRHVLAALGLVTMVRAGMCRCCRAMRLGSG